MRVADRARLDQQLRAAGTTPSWRVDPPEAKHGPSGAPMAIAQEPEWEWSADDSEDEEAMLEGRLERLRAGRAARRRRRAAQ